MYEFLSSETLTTKNNRKCFRARIVKFNVLELDDVSLNVLKILNVVQYVNNNKIVMRHRILESSPDPDLGPEAIQVTRHEGLPQVFDPELIERFDDRVRGNQRPRLLGACGLPKTKPPPTQVGSSSQG